MKIDTAFQRARSDGRIAFMPFVTAGDPEVATTVELIRELSRRGVDLIEVGFPYSDPIADGPVIQASYTRALDNGLRIAQIFDGIAEVAQDERTPPLVAMVAYSIIHRTGVDEFLGRAAGAGFSGLIVPDLPGDEADELFAAAHVCGLSLVQLLSPTTPMERVERIVQNAGGFVYCISIAGTTGERDRLPEALKQQLAELRNVTDLPLAVGFGVSRPEHIAELRGLADGAIVGSAIVRRMEALSNGRSEVAAVIGEIGAFAEEMLAACRG